MYQLATYIGISKNLVIYMNCANPLITFTWQLMLLICYVVYTTACMPVTSSRPHTILVLWGRTIFHWADFLGCFQNSWKNKIPEEPTLLRKISLHLAAYLGLLNGKCISAQSLDVSKGQ